MPLQQGHVQRTGHFLGQHGLACAGLTFDEQRALQGGGSVDSQHQILRGYVFVGTLKLHGRYQRKY